MSIPLIDPQLIVMELTSSRNILEKWIEEFQGGIPGVETPGTDEATWRFMTRFCSELRLVSGKCEVLIDAISSTVGTQG